MKDTKVTDIKFGLNGEQYTKCFIEKYLNISINHTEDDYHNFDFISEDKTIFIEVKTRNLTYSKAKYYKELFISTSKIGYIKRNPNKTYYFCYNLIDAILIYKYETGELKSTLNGRKNERLKRLNLLPVKDMVCIHKK
tara:strand:- start:1016 stop:1429 length:414 start_codon:yes stop_codon:yes gene_type:complete